MRCRLRRRLSITWRRLTLPCRRTFVSSVRRKVGYSLSRQGAMCYVCSGQPSCRQSRRLTNKHQAKWSKCLGKFSYLGFARQRRRRNSFSRHSPNYLCGLRSPQGAHLSRRIYARRRGSHYGGNLTSPYYGLFNSILSTVSWSRR